MSLRVINWSKYQSYRDRKPPWIRFHRSTLDDFKFQKMAAESRALLPMLWLLACEDEDPSSGLIRADVDEITFRLRMTNEVFFAAVNELEAYDFIECIDFVTDPLRECDETVTPETETETETETDRAKALVVSGESDDIKAAVKMWNVLASEFNLSKVQKTTKSRKTRLAKRLNDCGGLEGWKVALIKVSKSPGLTGGNKRGWKADFDFLMQEASFTKLMEGKYDDWNERGNGQQLSGDELDQAVRDGFGFTRP